MEKTEEEVPEGQEEEEVWDEEEKGATPGFESDTIKTRLSASEMWEDSLAFKMVIIWGGGLCFALLLAVLIMAGSYSYEGSIIEENSSRINNLQEDYKVCNNTVHENEATINNLNTNIEAGKLKIVELNNTLKQLNQEYETLEYFRISNNTYYGIMKGILLAWEIGTGGTGAVTLISSGIGLYRFFDGKSCSSNYEQCQADLVTLQSQIAANRVTISSLESSINKKEGEIRLIDQEKQTCENVIIELDEEYNTCLEAVTACDSERQIASGYYQRSQLRVNWVMIGALKDKITNVNEYKIVETAKYDSDTSHYSKEALASVCATTNVMIKITTDRTVFGAYFFSELLNNDNSISDKNAAIFILTNGTIANIEQTTGFLKAFRWGPSEKVFNLGDVEVDLAESDESTTTVTVKPSTTYNTPDNDIYYPSTTTFLATRLVASTFSLSKP